MADFKNPERPYNWKPYPAGGNEAAGVPPVLFCDGPRGVVTGASTCFPVCMLRGATFDPQSGGTDRSGHRQGGPSPGREFFRRGLRKPSLQPGLGPQPGSLRRGVVPPWSLRIRLDQGRPVGERHRLRKALRVQLDGAGPVQGQRRVRQTDRAGGLLTPLPRLCRRRGSQRHERLQPVSGHPLRPSRVSARRGPQERMGLRRLRDERLRLGGAGHRRGRSQWNGHRDVLHRVLRGQAGPGGPRGPTCPRPR